MWDSMLARIRMCLRRRGCNFFYGIGQWLEEEKRCYKAFSWDLVRTKRKEKEVIIFFNWIQQWLEEEKKRRRSCKSFFMGFGDGQKMSIITNCKICFWGFNDGQKTKRKVAFYFS